MSGATQPRGALSPLGVWGGGGGSFVHTLGPEPRLQAPLCLKEVKPCLLRDVTPSTSEGSLAFHPRAVCSLPFAEQKKEGERNGS